MKELTEEQTIRAECARVAIALARERGQTQPVEQVAAEIAAWLLEDTKLQPFRLEVLGLVSESRLETLAGTRRLFELLDPLVIFVAGHPQEPFEKPNTKQTPEAA